MDIKNKIFQGNALEVLKTFPEKSVNMAITSPPYWGLRDYQSDDIIWDCECTHEHKWDTVKTKSKGMQVTGLRDWAEKEEESRVFEAESSFCTKCHEHEHDFSVIASPRRNRNVEDVKDSTTIQAGNVGSQHDLPETAFCSKCPAWKGSLGLEPTPDLFIKHLCDIFEETKRVLKDNGTLWINLGDTYGGTGAGHSKSPQGKNKQTDGQYFEQDKAYTLKYNATKDLSKSLVGIPFRFAIEMLERGWILRNTIVWHKRNCMPSSIRDRFTVDFEYVFFFSKNKRYFFNQQFEPHTSGDENTTRVFRPGTKGHSQLIKKEIAHGKRSEKENENIIMKYGEQGRNKRTVWTINTKPFPEAHFATFPEELIKTPILAGCPEGSGIVLDMFIGSGTTGIVALKNNRSYVGIEMSKEYMKLAEKRIDNLRIPSIFNLAEMFGGMKHGN